MALPKEFEFLKLGNSQPHQTTEMMEGKWVLITGATSGIGLATAHRFAKGKANLILLVRNREKAASLKQTLEQNHPIKVHYYLADFTNLHSVSKALENILQHHAHLDVLVNNAGLYATRRTMTSHGTETVLTVNHLASLLITETLLPLLINQQGRILQVNSEGHRFSGFSLQDPFFQKRRYTGLKSYGASKTAQLHTVWELASILKAKGVTINAMHPGAVKSDIGLNNGWLYRTFKKLIINRSLKKVEIASEAIYYLAASPTMQGISGEYFYLTHPTFTAKHAQRNDQTNKVYLWSKGLINHILKPSSS